MDTAKLAALRTHITENLRVQRGGAKPVPYIDIGHVLGDISSRQNHAIFGRRGCGKTLLLHHASSQLASGIKPIYLNLEDFKKHSFPNVLIEILDALFGELEKNLTGWFGKKARSRDLIQNIRRELQQLRQREDLQEREVRETEGSRREKKDGGQMSFDTAIIKGTAEDSLVVQANRERELKFKISSNKIKELDTWLPRLKQQVRDFFSTSSSVHAVFLELDDFYHLSRADQPIVMDYIHRLCKDVPLYFKVATLRHASTLYADRGGQPIGAQERHDYQSINVDFTLADFRRTAEKNRRILAEFGALSSMSAEEVDWMFKGEGFDRLVMAGGGVPRDFLSLFLEIIEQVQPPAGDGRIGKDDVRILSHANFERRIEELKQDSEGAEQGTLIKGIYVLRKFCVVEKRTNVMLVSEALLQQNQSVRALLYRLLDYRIVHSAAIALTHKSQPGTYQAFAIDIGCYAHMRVLLGRFSEIDMSDPDAKEKMRSAPILDEAAFQALWAAAPVDPEASLIEPISK